MDFQQVADFYNGLFARMTERCGTCYNADQCSQCIFQLDLTQKHPACHGFANREFYSRYLAAHFDFIETRPEIYNKILEEVYVG